MEYLSWDIPLLTQKTMADELVNAATSAKLMEIDWVKTIEICELVAHDPRQALDVIKAIKRRLSNRKHNTQLSALVLLELLMNNTGDHIHQHVIDTGVIPILVKIVMKKSELPIGERIFRLLDATQTSLGGASGKFPQYYTAYHDLVIAGVEFPERTLSDKLTGEGGVAQHAESETVPESSIIEKTNNAVEVLKEVLDAVDAQTSQISLYIDMLLDACPTKVTGYSNMFCFFWVREARGERGEFILDLVEQCSLEKQRVRQLIITSRDDKIISQAIELKQQLQKVLARHDNMLSSEVATTTDHFNSEEEEEEEPGQLFRRLCKGKACARPDDEETEDDETEDDETEDEETEDEETEDDETEPEFPRLGLLEERLSRPLTLEQSRQTNTQPAPDLIPPPSAMQDCELAHVAIPPPPAKHIERERFFRENGKDGATLSGHLRGLSFRSHNGSSSHSARFASSD